MIVDTVHGDFVFSCKELVQFYGFVRLQMSSTELSLKCWLILKFTKHNL